LFHKKHLLVLMMNMKNTVSMPPSKLSFYINVIKITFAILLVGFVLSQTDLSSLGALLQKISSFWLIFAFLLFALLVVIKAMQYHILLEKKTAYPGVLNVVIVQNAVSNFVATGAGIASYLTLFRLEQGVKLSRSALAFLLAKVGDLISIWLFMLISSLVLWPQVTSLHGLIVLLLTIISLAILFFCIVVFLRQKFVSMLAWLVDGLKLSRFGFINKLMGLLSSLAEQKHSFVFHMVGIGVVFSLVYMAVTMAWIYASLQTFSFSIGILPVIFVNIFMQLISYLPIQVFGGLGVNETTSLYLYGIFGFPQNELAAVLIATRLLFYLTNLAVLLYLPVYTLFYSPKTAEKH